MSDPAYSVRITRAPCSWMWRYLVTVSLIKAPYSYVGKEWAYTVRGCRRAARKIITRHKASLKPIVVEKWDA